MSKIPKGDSMDKPPNKNIKNIYVHKINSLIKLSRQNIANEEAAEMLNQSKISQKKIKKVYSETDKTALKLQKNRQSARKARQRKNLYIKLLQNQVVLLKKQLAQSQQVEESSSKYLNQIKNSAKQIQINHSHTHVQVQDDLDRYLSHDNVTDLNQNKQINQKKIERIDQVVKEFQYWFIPELMKSITNLKKSQRLDLNRKILANAQQQFQKDKQKYSRQQCQIRLMLPFEQQSPQLKITTIMKTLGKSMQQLKINLNSLGEITGQLKNLILEQETSQSYQISENMTNRMRYLINQFNICGVGDRVDKIIQRILRWNQFPTGSMLETMSKVVEFNRFIQKTIIQQDYIQERGQDSQIDQEKQEENGNDN